jgi:hypothetical protein
MKPESRRHTVNTFVPERPEQPFPVPFTSSHFRYLNFSANSYNYDRFNYIYRNWKKDQAGQQRALAGDELAGMVRRRPADWAESMGKKFTAKANYGSPGELRLARRTTARQAKRRAKGE